MKAGRHDTAERKRAQRHGREKGCRVNISGEQLEKAGIDPNGPVPYYRIWPGSKRTLLVQLYEGK